MNSENVLNFNVTQMGVDSLSSQEIETRRLGSADGERASTQMLPHNASVSQASSLSSHELTAERFYAEELEENDNNVSKTSSIDAVVLSEATSAETSALSSQKSLRCGMLIQSTSEFSRNVLQNEDPAKLPLGSIYHFPESYLATPYTLCVPNGAALADVTVVPPADVAFSSTEYIRTAAGNKVCLRSILCRSRKIHMAGKSIIAAGVILRGDLASIRIGKYVSVEQGTTLAPPLAISTNGPGYIPMTIGDYTIIGENCVVNAASIASGVSVADNCIIGKRCILKENCVILPGSIVAPDTVVPALTVFGGVPARYVGDVFESTPFIHKRLAMNKYKRVHVSF